MQTSNTAGLCGSAMKYGTFTVSKGSNFYILFAITVAGVVPRGGLKKNPCTSSIVQVILFLSVL